MTLALHGKTRQRQTLLIIFGVLAVLGAAMFAMAARPAVRANHVTPVQTGAGYENATCAQLDDLYGNGQTWSQISTSTQPIVGQKYYVTGSDVYYVEITAITGTTPKLMSWTSNIGIDAVMMKNANGANNLYIYDPPAESFGDTGLQSYLNPDSISHVIFCYDGITTPTPPPVEDPTITKTLVGGGTTDLVTDDPSAVSWTIEVVNPDVERTLRIRDTGAKVASQSIIQSPFNCTTSDQANMLNTVDGVSCVAGPDTESHFIVYPASPDPLVRTCQPQEFTNTAELSTDGGQTWVTAVGPKITLSARTDCAGIPTIEKTLVTATPDVNDNLSWTVEVSNTSLAGTDPVTFYIHDDLPGLVLESKVGCGAHVDNTGPVYDCIVGPQASGTLNFYSPAPTFNVCDGGRLPNTASLLSSPTAPAPGEIQSTAAYVVEPNPNDPACQGPDSDVTVDKSHTPEGPFEPGDFFTWTLTVTVEGDDTTGDQRLTDSIPAAFTPDSVAVGSPLDCSASSGNFIDCTLPSGSPEGTYSVAVTVRVSPDLTGVECTTYTNTVTITGPDVVGTLIENGDIPTYTTSATDGVIIECGDVLENSFLEVLKLTFSQHNGGALVPTPNDDDGWLITVSSVACVINQTKATDANGRAVFDDLPVCNDYVVSENIINPGAPNYVPLGPASFSNVEPSGQTITFTNVLQTFSTATPTNTPITPTNTPGNTPVNTPTNTPVNTPTNTPINTPTNTPVSPTNTPTNTPETAIAGEQTPGPATPVAPDTGTSTGGTMAAGMNFMLIIAGLIALSGGLAVATAGRRKR